MTRTSRARTTTRRRWPLVVGVVAVGASIAAVVGHPSPSASSVVAGPASQPSQLSQPSRLPPPPPPSASASIPAPTVSRSRHSAAVGSADGVVPAGVTVFDDAVPAVNKLDRGLLEALRRAATAASRDGVTFYVNSGWRSPAYQDQLLREAVATYGSAAAAARWVATAATSPHVAGDAVDIGPSDAAAWLSRRGAGYGLCQIYRNEPWHYELRPRAATNGCPRMYANPTQDPRMQR